MSDPWWVGREGADEYREVETLDAKEVLRLWLAGVQEAPKRVRAYDLLSVPGAARVGRCAWSKATVVRAFTESTDALRDDGE